MASFSRPAEGAQAGPQDKVKQKGACDMRKFLVELWKDESGISSVEYALLLAMVAAGIIFAADLLGTAVENEILDAANCIDGDLAPSDPKCGGTPE